MSLGIKAGLLSRLNQQEQTIMQLQSDSLKHELSQQQHESEVEQLQYQLAERDKEVSALRSELVRREKTVDKQRVELEDAMRHIEELQFAQVCVAVHADFCVMNARLKVHNSSPPAFVWLWPNGFSAGLQIKWSGIESWLRSLCCVLFTFIAHLIPGVLICPGILNTGITLQFSWATIPSQVESRNTPGHFMKGKERKMTRRDAT